MNCLDVTSFIQIQSVLCLQCSLFKSTSLKLALWLSREVSLSPASCTLYLTQSFSLNLTFTKPSPCKYRPISQIKQGFFPQISQKSTKGKKMLCHKACNAINRLRLQLPVFSLSALCPEGSTTGGLLDMFVTDTVLH